MNIIPDEFAAVKSEIETDPASVGYPSWDNTEDTARAIALLLVDRSKVDNPATAPQIPKPMDTDMLLGAVSVESIAKIDATALEAVSQRIEAGERAAVARWVAIALAKGWITQVEHDAIQADLQSTVADPNHPAQVLGNSRLTTVLGRTVGGISASEVTAILNS